VGSLAWRLAHEMLGKCERLRTAALFLRSGRPFAGHKSMIITTKRWLAISALSSAVLGACGPGSGVYCQSGSKYGTQCYSEADVKNDPNQRARFSPRSLRAVGFPSCACPSFGVRTKSRGRVPQGRCFATHCANEVARDPSSARPMTQRTPRSVREKTTGSAG
jgi:hypothetical protein